MEGWQTEKLGDICSIQLGATPARKMSRYYDSGKTTDNVWLSIADMPKTIGHELFDSKEYLSDEGANKVKLVKKGTLLFSFKLSIGRICFAGKDLRTNEAIAALDIKDSRHIDKKYLAWFLAAQDWDFITAQDEKLLGRTLNKAKLKEIDVIIPQLSEQKRIVAILDEAFAGIDQAIANTEKNLASARELFESYLNTIFTQKGKGWEKDTFSNLIESQTIGLSRGKKEQSYDYDYPYIKMHNITNDNRFNTDEVTSVKATIEEVNKYRLENGDLLFNTRNSKELVGKNCLYIWDNEKPVLFNNNIMRIRFKPKLRGDFTAVLFDFYTRSGRLESLKSGTTNVAAIYFRNLENFVLEYPTCKLQQEEIAKKVRQFVGYLEELEVTQATKINSLNKLKQSLLQKAFSGELTADMADEIAEAAE